MLISLQYKYMPKFPFYMLLNKQFTAKEMVILCNVISWIIIPGIYLLEYILQFNHLLLLKQSDYNKDKNSWVNILSPAKIQEVLLGQCYNKFKGPPDTQLNWQAFILIYFSPTNYIPANYYRLKVDFKPGECIELIMLKQSSNWFLGILGL